MKAVLLAGGGLVPVCRKRRHYVRGLWHFYLTKPRSNTSEVSASWRLNAIRNTIYLYMKHYGLVGKGGAALRLTFMVDVGLISVLRALSRANAKYFWIGVRARAGAYAHYAMFLLGLGAAPPPPAEQPVSYPATTGDASGDEDPHPRVES